MSRFYPKNSPKQATKVSHFLAAARPGNATKVSYFPIAPGEILPPISPNLPFRLPGFAPGTFKIYH